MLVSKKHKKLVLNLRDPERITTIIPTAKTMQYKGQTLVAIPHRLEETRVLRNLGIDTPAPMGYYYDWPGRYKPFVHQKTTSEFLTLNPRAFVLNGMGCISGDETVRVSRKGKSYETTLRELHAKFHSLPDKDSWKVRSLKGDRFGMNTLIDSLYKGEQETLRFTLADGKTFRCTPDHRIARPDGSWTEAGDLALGDALVTNGNVMLACPECGVEREVHKYYVSVATRLKRVCNACRHKAHGPKVAGGKNPAYKGVPFTDNDGYVRLWLPEHHRADNSGRVYEHIIVAEAAYGGPITAEYHVHHLNGVKDDNRPENLEVLLAGDHHRQHDHRVKLDGSISAKGGVVVVLPKQSIITAIDLGGVTDVYDLSMEAPHHNFVVNGVVVHNSGKTVSVLWAFDYLKKLGLVKRMLVISPLSTLERAWGDEIFRHFPELTFAVLHGDRQKRHQLLANDFDIYVINHDGIKNDQTVKLLNAREGLDLIVVDEVASFRNSSTERWKALNALINGSKKLSTKRKEWAWGLTGTPIPNAPTDAWAQVKLINPSNAPGFFGQFRDTVMKPSGPFGWVMRESALDTVKVAMQPAVRFSREECVDLPPTTFVTRQTVLTPEQKKAYDQMLKLLKAECEGGQVSAINEAVKMSKLLQICCGVAYGTDGTVELPNGPRTELVREIIEEAEAKVLVFVPFTGALNRIADELRKDFTVEIVDGSTSKSQRDTVFKDFQSSVNPRVLVCNPQTLSHGLTLTAGNTIIWYAPISSNETYQQACARITRPGQKLNTLIVHIEATALEQKLYTRLQGKEKTQGLLLQLMKELK